MSKLTESDLNRFSGSDNWYHHWTKRLVFTDGVKYLADKGEAHWLIDAIASYQVDPRITQNYNLRAIQFWKLEVNDGKGVLTCVEDTGMKPAITQKIPFTDFPLSKVDIWVEYGSYPTEQGGEVGYVAMLPSER